MSEVFSEPQSCQQCAQMAAELTALRATIRDLVLQLTELRIQMGPPPADRSTVQLPPKEGDG